MVHKLSAIFRFTVGSHTVRQMTGMNTNLGHEVP